MNFLYDDIVHVLQNTIDSCINSATDRRGYVLKRRFTKLNGITQCNGRPLRRSRSFKVTDFNTNRKLIYDFLSGLLMRPEHETKASCNVQLSYHSTARPRPRPRPKKWSRRHAGLETLTSLLPISD